MRKTFPFLISLLLTGSMLNAQQKQTAVKRPISNSNKQQATAPPAELKIDPGLLQIVQREREQSKPGDINTLKASTNTGIQVNKKNDGAPAAATKADTKVAVNITGKVTPALVKVITDAGGIIVSSSRENNLITANVPASSLKTVAASPYVEQISQAQSQNTLAEKAEKNNYSVTGKGGKKSTDNIMSESVQKSRKQNHAAVKTATY